MDTKPVIDNIGLDRLLSHTHDGVFALDSQRRYVLFNSACERLTGHDSSEVLGGSCGCVGITDCRDEQGRTLETTLCPGWAVLKGEVPTARQRMRIRTKSGEHRWVETGYTLLLGDDGRTECVIGVMRDISEAKEREDQWGETTKNLREEVARLRRHMYERYGFGGIVSRSPKMQAVLDKIHAACSSNVPVLITGENGTGKEMVARTIHFNGLQKEGPFVPVSCSGTSRESVEGELFGRPVVGYAEPTLEHTGFFCAADGGTLFLEEVSSLPNNTQARLLRTMQDRSIGAIGSVEQHPVNARVIAVTNRAPSDLVSSGKLREDLFYRLSVITIELPPLRLRKEDLPFLVEHFITEFGRTNGDQFATDFSQGDAWGVKEIEPGVWPILEAHDWPGNVRELQNAVESALVKSRGEVLRAEDVSTAIRGRAYVRDQELDASPILLDDMLADIERRTILAGLRRARGQRSLAAKLMGISRSRLYRRMEALGIVPREQQF